MKKQFLGLLTALLVGLSSTIAMAYTLTPNHSFYLPGVNDPSDANNWGTYLNDNFSSLDSLIITAAANNTFTGDNTFSHLITATLGIKFPTGVGIYDGNSNNLLLFTTTSSAVNGLTIANAATAANPTISATGSDTNVGINFQTKGTGTYRFLGTSTASAEIKLHENTGNGTNYISLAAPTSVTSDTKFTLPSADGTANQVMTTNGSGQLAFTTSSALSPISASSYGTSGYITFGGFMIQWGTYPSAGTITFPLAFPTACLSVTANSTANNQSIQEIVSMSTTGFVVSEGNVNSTGQYIAIGH